MEKRYMLESIEYQKEVDREVDAHFGRKTHGI